MPVLPSYRNQLIYLHSKSILRRRLTRLFVLNKNFLVQTIIITFIYLSALFIVQNSKKFLQQILPELSGCAIFGPKIVHLPKQFFYWKIINIILIYLLAPFIVPNF